MLKSRLTLGEVYSYQQLILDCGRLQKQYPACIQVSTIGQSVEGRKIVAIRLGNGSDEVLISGAYHAREWLTAFLLMDIIETYVNETEILIEGSTVSISDVLDQCSLWFIPMVNPDGVTLVQDGPDAFENKQQLLEWNHGSRDFSSWKANSRGVDLNRQYPADWDFIQANPGIPASENFKGNAPLSEPESQSVYQFVQSHAIKIAAAYHSSGEEIYWKYKSPKRLSVITEKIALRLADLTGYQLIYPEPNPSGGGFTDWFLSHYHRPSFTIEIAPYVGPKPVPLIHYARIFQQNVAVPLLLANHRHLTD